MSAFTGAALAWDDGMRRHVSFDESTGLTVVRTTQDVEPILEANKVLYNEDGGGWSPTREMRRVASIPLVVVHKWLQEGINIFDKNDRRKVLQRLNDPEWRHLRTAPGRV